MADGRLEGEVAIVTGGASGIGRGVVERFLAEGACVAVVDITADRFEAPAGAEDRAIAIDADVRTLADNQRAVAQVVDRFGKLDVFVANAGIVDAFTHLVDIPDDAIDAAFDELFDLNVKAYLLGVKAALPALLETRGCVIFTLSNASFYPDGGGPIYTATKHADLGLMRQLAFELAPVVRVNGVAPGGTPTDLRLPRAFGTEEDGSARRGFDVPGIHDLIRRVTPLALAAEPRDHAGAYVLLASREDGRAMTGSVIETYAGLGVRGIRNVRGGDGLMDGLLMDGSTAPAPDVDAEEQS